MDFAQRTVELARRNVEEGGRPFATVIVKDGEVIAERANQVAQTHDPTGTTIYVLAHPCPMCLGSLYYCSPDEVVFLTTRDAYEPYYVDDRKYFELSTFYDEFGKHWTQRRLPMRHQPMEAAVDVYRRWNERNGGERRVT